MLQVDYGAVSYRGLACASTTLAGLSLAVAFEFDSFGEELRVGGRLLVVIILVCSNVLQKAKA